MNFSEKTMMKIYGKKILIFLVAVSLIVSGNFTMCVMANEMLDTSDNIITMENTEDVEELAGSSKSIIEIATEKDLKNISKDIYGNYRLKKNIKLSGAEWESIPEFYGTLDGNGYTISNLKSTKGQGLIGVLYETATIKNLTVSGDIDTKKKGVALLAKVSYGSIINCVTEGSVKQSGSKSDSHCSLGGMVVENVGYMERCVNKASVEHAFVTDNVSASSIGGLTAIQSGTMIQCENRGDVVSCVMSSGGITGGNSNLIQNCTNTGNVTSKCDGRGVALQTGGISGWNGGLINKCLNQGNICTTAQNNSYNIGGIAGESYYYSAIVDCKNQGSVSGYIGNIGGVLGEASIESGTFVDDILVINPGEVVVTSCVNEGKIMGTSLPNYTTGVGGVIGKISSAKGKVTLDNCINKGEVLGTKGDEKDESGAQCGGVISVIYVYDDGKAEVSNLANYGEVRSEGGWTSGVFCGAQASADDQIIISNCYNTANLYGENVIGVGVTSSSGPRMFSCYNVGNVSANDCGFGITCNIEGVITDCYNLGNVTARCAYGVGGMLGEKGEMKNVYNLGKVEGKDSAYSTVSSVNGVLENCYYLDSCFDTETIGERFGTAISAEDAQKAETYAGFDFDTVWGMKNQNDMYLPYLKFQDTVYAAQLSKDQITLGVGDTEKLISANGKVVGCYSGNATLLDVGMKYDKNGASLGEGYASAKRVGKTVIYVLFDNGQILTCQASIKNSITKATVTLSATNYDYDGKAKKPSVKSVKVKLDNETKSLKKGKDYTISYENNKNIGTASVIITGKGNYTGRIVKKFKIKAKKGSTYTVDSYKYKIISSSKVAFAGIKSKKATKVTIPKTVTIGGKTFKVTSIESKALYNKTKVRKVIIGANVTKIGKEAFAKCSKLSTIIIDSKKLKTVGENAFKDIKSNAKIKVPAKKLRVYKKLLKGKGQGSKVKIMK